MKPYKKNTVRITMEGIYGFFEEYRFLSNFYPSTVLFNGMKFVTVEHAFQAAKALDTRERILIQMAKTPNEARRLGQKVALRKDWESVKVKIMTDLCCNKFNRHPILREALRETGSKYLEESNHWGDKFWGVAYKPGSTVGVGKNVLGRILMTIRDNLEG